MPLQRRTITVASVGAAAILAVGLTAGAASATGSTPATKTTVGQLSSVSKAAPDTDNVQQGDQTTPDVPGVASPEKAGAEKAGTEKAGTEKAGAETPDASDGPGGHADAPGTVDHQFRGQE
ncbi:MAG: hypothetical protein QOG10_6695 [Kribbellaceae bacterium]|nr:hypothetical protein [Kribbellaceae bacterium]